MPTKTRPFTVSVSKYEKKANKENQVTHEDLFKLQTQMGTGSKKILQVTQTLLESHCKIEPNFRPALFERNRTLQDHFFEKKIDIINSSGTITPTARVFCKDIPKLINFVKNCRNLSDDCLTRISFDGGQSSFKISASIFDPNKEKKSGKFFLDSGVKKILIIALVPDCPENYANLQTILSEINLDSLDIRNCLHSCHPS